MGQALGELWKQGWGMGLGTDTWHNVLHFPAALGRAVLQKENSQSRAPAPALQIPARGEMLLT